MGRSSGSSDKLYKKALAAQKEGTQYAVNELRNASQYIPSSISSNMPFGQVSSTFDSATGKVSSNGTVRADIQQLFDQQIQDALNLNSTVEKKTQDVLAGSQRDVKKELGDLFYQLGGSGRNSAAQNVAAKFGEELAYKDAQRKQSLESEIRNSLLAQQAQLYSQALNPISSVNEQIANYASLANNNANSRTDLSEAIADAYSSSGQASASILSQQASARAQQRQAKNQQMLGLAQIPLSGITSAFTKGMTGR